MHHVYLGFARHASFRALVEGFDLDFDHPEGLPKFSQVFGCGQIEPGSFEVYDRDDYPGFSFDAALLDRLLPFRADPDLVARIDFAAARAVFYLEVDAVTRTDDGDICLLGPQVFDAYDFERPDPPRA